MGRPHIVLGKSPWARHDDGAGRRIPVNFGFTLEVKTPHKGRGCGIQLMIRTIPAQPLDSQADQPVPQSFPIPFGPGDPPNILGSTRIDFNGRDSPFFQFFFEFDPSLRQTSHRSQGDRKEGNFSSPQFQVTRPEMLIIFLMDGFSSRRQCKRGIYGYEIRFPPADRGHDIFIRIGQHGSGIHLLQKTEARRTVRHTGQINSQNNDPRHRT